ncbi:uncharacterized protein BDW47DRAFT_100781 [Aspergillus candidus]|uniref:Uncharacterized protein n=1 Tax=Aspergillus candidus TaxID=41067 RepID=A0A2I2FJF4_ASPCN|nr:hypothetical protein BDW47DRAFT_100781 [Aspergillus candidus]PLB40756.1 hypothetical protein BDW47DRAFT_100781 [Aspergillus candidus]
MMKSVDSLYHFFFYSMRMASWDENKIIYIIFFFFPALRCSPWCFYLLSLLCLSISIKLVPCVISTLYGGTWLVSFSFSFSFFFFSFFFLSLGKYGLSRICVFTKLY